MVGEAAQAVYGKPLLRIGQLVPAVLYAHVMDRQGIAAAPPRPRPGGVQPVHGYPDKGALVLPEERLEVRGELDPLGLGVGFGFRFRTGQFEYPAEGVSHRLPRAAPGPAAVMRGAGGKPQSCRPAGLHVLRRLRSTQ
ncbi:hypothetical protein RB201_00065 [Streptomyces sp. S1A(2023)]